MSRHRFEPARLLTGLLLFGAGLAYLLDAVGAVRLHAAFLALLVPVALLAGAFAGLLTCGVRRALTRRQESSATRRAEVRQRGERACMAPPRRRDVRDTP